MDNLYLRKNEPMKDLLNNRLFRIICISAIGLFTITWLVGWLTGSDLGIFPFDANVWGTASDYFTIVAAVGSLYFVGQTFKLQDESNKLLISEMRLKFLYGISYELSKTDLPLGFTLFLRNTGEPIDNVVIDFISEDYFEGEDIETYYRSYRKRKFRLGKIEKEYPKKVSLLLKPSKLEVLLVSFQDIRGLKYSQKLILLNGQIISISQLDHN